MAALKHVPFVLGLRERGQNEGERAVGVGRRDGSLAAKDLPQSDQSLQRSGGIGAYALILDLLDAQGDIEELVDGSVRDFGDSGENGILSAEQAVFPGHAVGGFRVERGLAMAIKIAQSHEDFQRLVFHRFAAQAKQRFENVVGILPA